MIMSPSSVEARPTTVEDMLERSLDMLERSEAMLERSLAMENTLLRFAEGQEELRRMIMAMVNGNDVSEMIPVDFVKREEGYEIDVPGMTPVMTSGTGHPTNDPTASVKNKERKEGEKTPAVKDEEDKDDEIEMVELPSATPAYPAEEDDDITSVSSVSTDEDVDYIDSSSAHDLEAEEKMQETNMAEDDEDEGCSTSSRSPGSSYQIESDYDASSVEKDIDSDDEMAEANGHRAEDHPSEGSKNASVVNKTKSKLLSIWKCAVCGKRIRGVWQYRRHHIESHEGLKLSCPVIECSARISNHHFVRHLMRVHKTTKSSLPVEQLAEFQRQQDENNQKAMACEMKYFPPSSLVSFPGTSGRNGVKPTCKKCGKVCDHLTKKRDHVGAHLNRNIQCLMDLSGAHHLEAEEGIQGNEMAEESKDDEDEGCSTSSGGLGSSYEIDSDYDAVSEEEGIDSDEEMTEENSRPVEDSEGSKNASVVNKTKSKLLSVWKCAVCEKMIREKCRRHHIESHEDLKLSCPVTGCSARRSGHYFTTHLRLVHKTAKSSLSVEQRAELKRQQDEINQKAMECEKKYFPSSSLTSFAETSGKIAVNTACKKCGKTYVDLPYRRNHVGHHLNMKIQCPIRGCKSSGTVHTITRHLWSKHKKALSKLTKQERNRFEEARRKFYEEVDTVMEEYFPEQRTDEVEPFCKKCGKNRPSVRDRRDHVGEHINVKFPCPFRNCAFSGCVKQMFAHLRYTHRKNLSDLTREQQSRYEESRRKFHEKVDAVMGRYFS